MGSERLKIIIVFSASCFRSLRHSILVNKRLNKSQRRDNARFNEDDSHPKDPMWKTRRLVQISICFHLDLGLHLYLLPLSHSLDSGDISISTQ